MHLDGIDWFGGDVQCGIDWFGGDLQCGVDGVGGDDMGVVVREVLCSNNCFRFSG